MQRRVGRVPALVVCALVVFASARHGAAQTTEASHPTKDAPSSVLIFAAASTANAMDEIRARFTNDTGIATQTSYGSSATLVRQIENGAPADILLSADAKCGDYLAEKGFAAEKCNLLGNRLVLIVPLGLTLPLHTPADLLSASVGHLALGDPDSVPAGKYAKQAFTKLELWDRLKPKVVAAEDVRHAVAFVETGAAEAGVVYTTDAAISKKVKVAFDIAESLTGPVRYPLVLLKSAPNTPAATALYRYLVSDDATKIYRKYGFTILAEPAHDKSQDPIPKAPQ